MQTLSIANKVLNQLSNNVEWSLDDEKEDVRAEEVVEYSDVVGEDEDDDLLLDSIQDESLVSSKDDPERSKRSSRSGELSPLDGVFWLSLFKTKNEESDDEDTEDDEDGFVGETGGDELSTVVWTFEFKNEIGTSAVFGETLDLEVSVWLEVINEESNVSRVSFEWVKISILSGQDESGEDMIQWWIMMWTKKLD